MRYMQPVDVSSIMQLRAVCAELILMHLISKRQIKFSSGHATPYDRAAMKRTRADSVRTYRV